MARMELTQGIVELPGFVKRRFGIFGDHAGITLQRGAKCAQAFTSGVVHPQRFTQKQNGLEALFNQMFGCGRGGLGVIQPDHITGEIGNFTVNQHHRQRRLLQAVQPLFAHPDAPGARRAVRRQAGDLSAAAKFRVIAKAARARETAA